MTLLFSWRLNSLIFNFLLSINQINTLKKSVLSGRVSLQRFGTTRDRAPFRRRPAPVHHQLMITFIRPCRPPGPSASGVPVPLGAGETLSGKAVPVKSEAAPSASPWLTCEGRIQARRGTVWGGSRGPQRGPGRVARGFARPSRRGWIWAASQVLRMLWARAAAPPPTLRLAPQLALAGSHAWLL